MIKLDHTIREVTPEILLGKSMEQAKEDNLLEDKLALTLAAVDTNIFTMLYYILGEKDSLDCHTKVVEYIGNLILKDIGKE